MDKQEFDQIRASVLASLPRTHARTQEEAMAAIDRAQAIAFRVIPRDRSLVDEWLEEKRIESARG